MYLLTSRATRLVVSLVACVFVSSAVVAAQPTSRSIQATYSELVVSLPECEATCFTAAVANSTCTTSDMTCICSSTNQAAIIDYMRECGNPNCTVDESLRGEQYVKVACGATQHDEASHLRSISWTLYAVALACFGSRMIARTSRFGGIFWYDDWFIVASFAVLTAVSIGAELMFDFGMGRDIWQLDSTRVTIVLILFYVAEFAYVIESALTKTSIVVLYLRIFPSRGFRVACLSMLAFIVCFALAFIITLLTYCVPFTYVWTMWDHRHSGTCINMTAQTYVCASLNIIMDVTIFLMPIPKLIKLETDWKTKIGVIFTFLLGLFVTVCSIIRLKYLAGWASSTNQTYDYAALALWSLIELNAGVICACLPGMASLFRRIKKSHDDKKRSQSYGNSYGNNSSASKGGSRMLNSGLRTYGGSGGGGPGDIMKTTSVSVQYKQRADDELSDEVELMDQGVPDALRMNRIDR
ncbi:hypothetical protein M406DRAFT_327427 [Cryphonectria parasitica EP155]|uniref:CFEM domain-containing protein n=1 Tax=Cryphonectria parasitica (strain ATCC 38755 / EP155) TaxID=660469 RepID=A0A9P4YAD9_CRYP1|nr:uncharacterized protein M406DRAFT_327427 [Cryphonectria parasitica EP155]KAF3769020.1 hypothetical protein M406DRAFT_327427 [Cryphonectria parasitica EP155]